jgi:hypothetical protein
MPWLWIFYRAASDHHLCPCCWARHAHWQRNSPTPVGDATITHLSSTLIALFPTEDIAVLETPDPGPTFAPFSAEVSLGQRLTALGFPLKGSQPTFD